MEVLSQLLKSIVKNIAAELVNDVERCEPLAGYIETTEVSAIHTKTPGVFIASVGSGDATPVETGEIDTIMQMVAYILVVEKDSLRREKKAQRLVTKMLMFVPGNHWGLPNVFPAKAVESADLHGLTKGFKPDVSSWRSGVSVLARASDLYGGTDPIANISLWAITWEQMIRIGTPLEDNDANIPDQVIMRLHEDIERVV